MRTLLVLLLGLTGCSKSGSLVFVTVDAAAPLASASRLHVTLVDGTTRTTDVPLSPVGFPPAHSFAVDVGAGVGGTMQVTVDAFDAAGNSLGTAGGSVAIVAGKRVDLALTLGGSSPADMAMTAPDGSAPGDMTGPPADMTYRALTWVPKQLGSQFLALWAADASHIWLGAEDTASNYYSTGNDVWTQVSANPFFQAGGIWGTDATHVYLVDGNGNIRNWIAGSSLWNMTTSSIGTSQQALTGIWGTSLNDIYVVGNGSTTTPTQLIFHNATGNVTSGWTTVRSVAGAGLNAVSGTTGQIYTVGTTGLILQSSDGVTWTQQPSGTTEELLGVFVLDAQHIYVVGNATLLFSSGNGVFTQQTLPQAYSFITLRGVWAADPDNVFVVGDKGAILHGDSTGAWVVQTSGLEGQMVNINAVWGVSAHDVYAAADGWVVHGQ